jgi:hypothetical protein
MRFFWFGNYLGYFLKNWPFFNSYGHPDIENSFGSKERGIWNIIRIVFTLKDVNRRHDIQHNDTQHQGRVH